ncbi:alpha/beta hydrolase [Sphingomonas sp. So64.6b]|uniref:alpha/beta hydrolase n=1 Tax=Sphingomonas sp. So64.6b TaxID=2997354 RepID=UPI0015FFB99B|nr:alpha/beta hydrolase [Sphingomonas sp. So64.6b]QNA85437.1 alpha/beta hydrolase [Sphingomonas sp. So64.6b]
MMKPLKLVTLLIACIATPAVYSQTTTGLNPINEAPVRAILVPYTEADLDAGSRLVLDRIAANEGPAPWTLPPVQLRQGYDAFFGQFSLPNPHVASRENRTIAGPNGQIPISIFRPLGAVTKQLPVMVYFHGGGAMTNSTDTYDSMLQLISAKSGAAIVSVDYRLAPEHRFPQGIDDSYAALQWVHAEGASVGLDSSRIAVGGDSAGGNIAAVVSQMARDRHGPPLQLQVLIYPAVGTRGHSRSMDLYAQGYFFGKAELAWIYAQYVEDAKELSDPRVQPILATRFDGLPSALVIVPEFDIMRDDGEEYASLMRDAGVSVDLHRYRRTIHAFVNMGGAIPAGRDAIDEVAAKLAVTFRNGKARPAPSRGRRPVTRSRAQ